MFKKFVDTVYSVNYIFQGIFCLLTPIGLMCLLAWFLTAKLGVPDWIWAVLIVLGVFSGLVSMIRYLVSVSEIEKRREKEQESNGK